MSPDRLKELQHQRTLAQEQLAWIEREIARETAGLSGAIPQPPTPRPSAVIPIPTPTPAAPHPADAERIIEQYQANPASLHQEVRRGCLLYAFAAFALLALGVTVLWFIFSR